MVSQTNRYAAHLVIALRATFNGLVTATGVLALLTVVAAALTGGSVADFYAWAFPKFRGVSPPSPVSLLAYVIFCAYVIFGSAVAVVSRRRMAAHLHSNGSAKATSDGAA